MRRTRRWRATERPTSRSTLRGTEPVRRRHGRAHGLFRGVVRYPIVEMVETDLPNRGVLLYAITVPKPGQPRSMATDEDISKLLGIPHLSHGANLRRVDDGVFSGTANGPSLRLIVPASDQFLILEHALWVGDVRGGGRLLSS